MVFINQKKCFWKDYELILINIWQLFWKDLRYEFYWKDKNDHFLKKTFFVRISIYF